MCWLPGLHVGGGGVWGLIYCKFCCCSAAELKNYWLPALLLSGLMSYDTMRLCEASGKKVQVGNNQEKAQSEKDSHSDIMDN